MRHHHSPGIRGQLMWFLCCICLFLLALVWFLSTQLLEPLYTKHIEKQLTTQAESITAELDKAIANGEALSAWSFGHLTVNTAFFDRLATQLYASGSLNSFCVDISDTTMRTIYKIENQSYCNLHETRPGRRRRACPHHCTGHSSRLLQCGAGCPRPSAGRAHSS